MWRAAVSPMIHSSEQMAANEREDKQELRPPTGSSNQTVCTQKNTRITKINPMTKWKPSVIRSKHHETDGMNSGNKRSSTISGGQSSELLQELSEVRRLGQLAIDSRQLVEDGTVEGHAGDVALCGAAAVPADLQTDGTCGVNATIQWFKNKKHLNLKLWLPHHQQLLSLALPLAQVLVKRHGDSLWVGAAASAHAQLSQLVAHGAVQRGEVLRDRSLPPRFISCRRRRARRLLDLRRTNQVASETRPPQIQRFYTRSSNDLKTFHDKRTTFNKWWQNVKSCEKENLTTLSTSRK